MTDDNTRKHPHTFSIIVLLIIAVPFIVGVPFCQVDRSGASTESWRGQVDVASYAQNKVHHLLGASDFNGRIDATNIRDLSGGLVQVDGTVQRVNRLGSTPIENWTVRLRPVKLSGGWGAHCIYVRVADRVLVDDD